MFDISYNTKDDNSSFTEKQLEEDKYNHIYFAGKRKNGEVTTVNEKNTGKSRDPFAYSDEENEK